MIDTYSQRKFLSKIAPGKKYPQMDDVESVARCVIYLLCEAPKTMTGQSIDLFSVKQSGHST